MKNLVIAGETYPRIFRCGNYKLLKYSSLTPEAWQGLKSKNMSFLNVPTTVYPLTDIEQGKYPESNSKVILPVLKDYTTLYNESYTHNLTTEELLGLLKYSFGLLRTMNEKDVYHGDVLSKNVMINAMLDINFIDLDAAIVDDMVSNESVYFEDDLDISSIKDNTESVDKLDLLRLYLYYLATGNFRCQMFPSIDIGSLLLPKDISKELESYLSEKQRPKKGYYFEDIFRSLEKKGYEAPKIHSRKNC